MLLAGYCIYLNLVRWFYSSLVLDWIVTNAGLAMKREEYVPDKTPINRVRQNAFIVVPPRKINVVNTMIVVVDVFIVRRSVWFNEIFEISINE